tara:strand:+ start:3207 stop:7586 length:4380 start_codon:yes stop_codon:yes gene_type:complete
MADVDVFDPSLIEAVVPDPTQPTESPETAVVAPTPPPEVPPVTNDNIDRTGVFEAKDVEVVDEPNETIYDERSGQVIEGSSGSIERLYNISMKSFQSGEADVEASKLNFELFTGNDTPLIRKRLAELKKLHPTRVKTDGWVEEGARAFHQQLPMLMSVMGNAADRGMKGAIAFGTAGLAFAGVGAVPGFFSGGGAGMLVGSMEQTFVLETGNLYGEISEFKDKKGNKVHPDAARIAAVAGGALSAGLEMVPMALIFKMVPGSKKLIGNFGSKYLKVPKGKSAMLNFVRNISTIMVTETVTEGGQQLVQDAAKNLALLSSDVEVPLTSASQAMDNAGKAMVEALKATPLLAVGFSSPRLVSDIKNNRAEKKANERPDTIQERVAGLDGTTLDSVTTKIRQSPISEKLTTYKVPNLTPEEVKSLDDIGVDVAADGSIAVDQAELVAAESMRRTDFYQEQLAAQSKVAETEETKALRQVARGRIKKLDNDIKSIDEKVDLALSILAEREATGKPVKALNNRIDTMIKKRESFDLERAELLTSERPIEVRKRSLDATGKDIELKGAELLKAQRRQNKAKDRALQKGMREGVRIGKKDVKAAQSLVIDTINASELSPSNKAKFLTTIKNIQTAKQLERGLPRIQNKIEAIVTEQRHKKAITKLKKELKTSKVKGKKGRFGPEIQDILDTARKALSTADDTAQAILDGRSNNGTSEIPTPTETLENTLLMLAIDPKSVDVGTIENLLESIVSLKEAGRDIRSAPLLAKNAVALTHRTELLDLIGPEVVETSEQRTRRKKLIAAEVNLFLGFNGAFWNKLRRVMRSPDKRRVDSLTNTLSLFKESRAFDRGKKRSVERFNELMLRAMDTTSERDVMTKLQADEIEPLHFEPMVHSDGSVRLLDVETKAQVRKRVMELRDPALKKSMMNKKGNAYTEDIITVLEGSLDPVDYRIIDAQLQFYEEYYQRINKVYSRVYGYNLPKLEFYSPIKRIVSDDKGNTVSDEFMKGIIYQGGVAPSSLKSRTSSIAKVDHLGDFAVFQSHISEMEYFMAYAEKVQQLQQVIGHADVKNRIKTVYGDEMWATISSDLQAFAKRGVENSIVGEKLYVTLMRNFSFAQLGAKPQIGLKQLVSFSAFAEDVSTRDFIEGMTVFAKNPRAALLEMNEGSEFFRERGSGNIDQDYQSILSDQSWFNVVGKNPRLASILMLPIKLGDKSAIALGGYAHFHAMKKKNGGDKIAAMESTELLAVRTQQSSDIDQLSAGQRSNAFTRIMTQFMSSSNALARAEYNAIIDKSTGRITRKEFAKRLIIYHAIVPTMIQFVANGFNWDSEDQLRASILGSLNGVFILNDVFNLLATAAISGVEDVRQIEIRNPLHFFNDMTLAIAEIAEEGISFEDFVEGTKAIERMAKVGGELTGIPLKTLIGELRGVYHVFEGAGYGDEEAIKTGFAEILGYSSYTIDNKILADD